MEDSSLNIEKKSKSLKGAVCFFCLIFFSCWSCNLNEFKVFKILLYIVSQTEYT